jgi:nitronate monooxygenase
LDLGADYLVCQGVEAGGHVQSSTALYELLPKVLDQARNTPVLAAGGISHGRKIREALLAGASGAMLGTRFVATQENLAHPEYKTLLIGNSSGGCVLFTLVLCSLIPYALVDEAGAQEAIARRGTLGRRT